MDDVAWIWLGLVPRASILLAIAATIALIAFRWRRTASPRTQLLAWCLVLMQGWLLVGINFRIPWHDPDQESIAASLREDDSQAVPVDTAAESKPLMDRPSDSANSYTAGVPRQLSAGLIWRTVLPSALLIVWCLGAVGISVVYVRRYAALSRRLRKWLDEPSTDPAMWHEELRQVRDELEVNRPVRLLVADSFGPMVCRIPREYLVIVPRAHWNRLPRLQRLAILRHELTHVRRGDIWKTLLIRILALPHWFNPMAWLVIRRFDASIELACDDTARGNSEDERLHYAKALYSLAEIDRQPLPFVPAATGGSLSLRIRRLLQPDGKETKMTRMSICLTLACVAALGMLRIELVAREPGDGRPATKTKPPVSLIINDGFETVRKGSQEPEDWYATRLPETAEHVEFRREQGIAHDGRFSVSIAIKESHPEQRVFYNWMTKLKGWKHGQAYDVTGWIRTDNVEKSPVICVQCINGPNRKQLGFATTEGHHEVTGNSKWRKVTAHFTVPADTTEVYVRAALASDNRGGKAWFDGIQVTKSPEAQLGWSEAVKQRRERRASAEPSGKGRAKAGAAMLVTYHVADLVVPHPDPVKISFDGKQWASADSNKPMRADFDSLIDLITSTISPESWEDVGGRGAISPFETNLSLVVRQTQEVHEQLSDLLIQLRRLQDVQVTFSTTWYVVSRLEYEQHGFDADQAMTPLTSTTVKSWQELVDGTASVSKLAGPKMTLFNGQNVELNIRELKGIKVKPFSLQSVVSADRRSVRISLTPSGSKTIQTVEVPDEGPVAVSLSGQLLKNSKGQQAVLLLRPTIVIAEEEEEAIGVDAALRVFDFGTAIERDPQSDKNFSFYFGFKR